MAQQPSVERCPCGRLRSVTATESPWEFTYRCACGQYGTWSFAHKDPPPTYEPREELPFAEAMSGD
jgi:hypothetical protein